jgi:hypothetical protein
MPLSEVLHLQVGSIFFGMFAISLKITPCWLTHTMRENLERACVQSSGLLIVSVVNQKVCLHLLHLADSLPQSTCHKGICDSWFWSTECPSHWSTCNTWLYCHSGHGGTHLPCGSTQMATQHAWWERHAISVPTWEIKSECKQWCLNANVFKASGG